MRNPCSQARPLKAADSKTPPGKLVQGEAPCTVPSVPACMPAPLSLKGTEVGRGIRGAPTAQRRLQHQHLELHRPLSLQQASQVHWYSGLINLVMQYENDPDFHNVKGLWCLVRGRDFESGLSWNPCLATY